MNAARRKYQSKCKPWLEYEGVLILGEDQAKLLIAIRDSASIRKAAEMLSIPYRTAWSYIQKLEKAVGARIVRTYRGGAKGGGGTELTEEGMRIVRAYERYEQYLECVIADKEFWEALSLKIPARNKLKGVVKGLEKSDLAATVHMEILTPAMITALITAAAVDDLDLKIGDEVEAVIKATEVMVSKEK